MKKIIFALALVLSIDATEVLAEPIDSLIWASIKEQPFLATHWKSFYNEVEESGIENPPAKWNIALMVGMKLTAFKKEVSIYDTGKTCTQDLKNSMRILSAYGLNLGGNWDEHWRPKNNNDKKRIITPIKYEFVQNLYWHSTKNAIKMILRNMTDRKQSIYYWTFWYVKDYFTNGYDLEKAKEFYESDAKHHKFAYADYTGKYHPARKVTAFVERLMFKHKVIELKEVKSWLQRINDFLKDVWTQKAKSFKWT